MNQIESGFRFRLLGYCIVLFLILEGWKYRVGDSQWLSNVTVFIVVYAYAQLMLTWKGYLDSADTTRLLTEIRDLLRDPR
jgi:hypothetical protein